MSDSWQLHFDYQRKPAVFFVMELFNRNRNHVHVGIPSSYRNTREVWEDSKMLWKHLPVSLSHARERWRAKWSVWWRVWFLSLRRARLCFNSRLCSNVSLLAGYPAKVDVTCQELERPRGADCGIYNFIELSMAGLFHVVFSLVPHSQYTRLELLNGETTWYVGSSHTWK